MNRFFASNRILAIAYLLAAVLVSMQSIWQGTNTHGYTAYENYVIFKNSFSHLINGLNPYGAFPLEQWDLYKYSPAFSLFMAPFSYLPDWIGLQLWNLVNTLPLLWAVLRLPILTDQQRRFLGWFILPELVVSLQNSQSNGLTAALLLWAWIALEQKKPAFSAFWTAAGGFLKIFGIFAAAPALLYPQRRVFLPALLGWSVLFFLAPLLVVSPGQLTQVYQWWLALLQEDHSASLGLSVIGWLQSWFGWMPSKTGVSVLGLAVLGLSTWVTLRRAGERELPPARYRLLIWASLLIWVVIFNHKAESPTFVIALGGVALWYLSENQPGSWQKTLLWTAFVLASVSPTDIFPRYLREHLVQPYVLKAMPCILIWILITVRLFQPIVKQQPSASDE